VQNTVESAANYPCYKKNLTDDANNTSFLLTGVFNRRTLFFFNATTAKDDQLRPRRQGRGLQHRGGFPRLLLPRHGRVAPRQRPLRRTLRHAARGQQLPAPHRNTVSERAPPQASACRRLLLCALPACRRLWQRRLVGRRDLREGRRRPLLCLFLHHWGGDRVPRLCN